MTLSELIRKRGTGNLATAIPAISATQPKGEAATVARIATVAVANPKGEKTAPTAKVTTLGDAPCPTCGCGTLWRDQAGAWWCEQCTPPGDEHVCTWRNIGGGKVPTAPPPAVNWPADLDAMLRRVATAFEWSQQDVTDLRQWAMRGQRGIDDARQFLEHECAKLPVAGRPD